MSVGSPHHRPNRSHKDELQRLTSEPSFRKMWARPFRIDTSKQVPDTAGYSVDAAVYYIDSDLAAAVKAGKVTVDGMSPAEIMGAIGLHERVEKCLLDADNDVDTYQGAHEMATFAEHLHVIAQGAKPRLYEAALRPYIKANETKPLTNVPLDLDCEPYIDAPDEADKAALAQMVKLSVADAGKVAKESVKYGKSTGADRCVGCMNWMAGKPVELSPCKIVSGTVRADRWCTKFQGGQPGGPA